MKNLQRDITQFGLSALAKAGLIIRNMESKNNDSQHDYSKPHRDNHYLLLLSTHGHFKLNLDFQEIEVNGAALLLIFPGQVHHIIDTEEPKGWAISFDSSLMDTALQPVLEQGVNMPVSLTADTDFYNQTCTLMQLLENLQTGQQDVYTGKIKNSLLDAIMGLVAGQIALFSTSTQLKPGRAAVIEHSFRQLLKQHFKVWKQPALYASALHITVAHLSDTVKSVTGYSVSSLIQSYSILEAKRLLWFTKLSVKEIGYELGYDEPVYFGKLFKKITGLTPLKFRQQYQV